MVAKGSDNEVMTEHGLSQHLIRDYILLPDVIQQINKNQRKCRRYLPTQAFK